MIQNSVITVTHRKNKLPIIQTERLILRDIELKDISPQYIKWLNDVETTKFLEIRFLPQTENMVKEYIRSKLKDITNTKHFGIYDSDGKRLIGTVTCPNINCPNINWYHLYTDISFVIGHLEARGKGYATEAVNAVVYYLFKECNFKKIWAGYYDGHDASANILKKIGFKVEGRLKNKLVNYKNERVDHVIVGLLAEDYFLCRT